MYFSVCHKILLNKLKLKVKKSILIVCLSKSDYADFIIENELQYINILKLDVEDKNFFDLNNVQLLNDFISNNDFDEVITC